MVDKQSKIPKPPGIGNRSRPTQRDSRICRSAWEIATKVRLGKLPEAKILERDFLGIMDRAGYTLIPIDAATALRAGRLTAAHGDPFDRLIVAQALPDDIPVLSADAKLDTFGVRRIW